MVALSSTSLTGLRYAFYVERSFCGIIGTEISYKTRTSVTWRLLRTRIHMAQVTDFRSVAFVCMVIGEHLLEGRPESAGITM